MKSLYNLFERKKTYNLTFYMKSGNVFVADNVGDYEITNKGDEITGVRFSDYYPKGPRVLLKTVALDQIEAITVQPCRR